jgi:hypothetical protein
VFECADLSPYALNGEYPRWFAGNLYAPWKLPSSQSTDHTVCLVEISGLFVILS